jgi:tetratricopeptide (TPR) repeat protein
MRLWVLLLLPASLFSAADPERLALALKAQTAFDRVDLAGLPSLADLSVCVQSQASVIPVSMPQELPLLLFRRGYCELAQASITGDAPEYLSAAADFDRAIQSWPGRVAAAARNQAPVPVSAALRILPWIARLRNVPDSATVAAARQEIAQAVEDASCNSYLMHTDRCEQILQTGRLWLGWIALREGQVFQADTLFAGKPSDGWADWTAGEIDFRAGRYSAAVQRQRSAIDTWKTTWQAPGPALPKRLGPVPDLSSAWADLGGSQLLAGDPKAAIASLDASLKLNPANPQAFYRRARAKDAAGQLDAAQADYSMASRTAFAGAKDLASGDAHLFRGIMLYRRNDFARAENEFSSALNLEIGSTLRADAQAWRHLAAVAAGTCGSEKDALESAMPSVSPYFPRDEARRAMAACAASASAPRQ